MKADSNMLKTYDLMSFFLWEDYPVC